MVELPLVRLMYPKLCGTPPDLARPEAPFDEGVLRRDWLGLELVLSLRDTVGLGGCELCWLLVPPLLLLPWPPDDAGSGSLPQYSRPFGPTELPLL